MIFLLFSVLVFTFSVYATNKVNYLDSYVTHYFGKRHELDRILFKYGYAVEKEIIPFYFTVRKKELTQTLKTTEINPSTLQREDNRVVSFAKEEYFTRVKRASQQTTKQLDLNVTDILWSEQWYLDPQHIPTMGVYNAWKKGFTGKGIVIAIIDDGIDTIHTDLANNYNASLSRNIIRNIENSSHMYPNERHGTNCAGIAAAVRNGDCIIGVAFEATLSAIRLLDVDKKSTASEEAEALIFKHETIDIYSSSWGPIDDGAGYETSDAISEIQQQALLHGVTKGRNGKGAIYVWASGNGGNYHDDCNIDGYSNSMYTISISALQPDGSKAWYAEECTAIMAVTYGGDSNVDEIATTDPGNRCIDDFQGTSAACPMAAGIIALVLEANQELTWRDIQHLIVETSLDTASSDANFYTNAVGKKVSLSHGFGMLNAELLVDSALSWKTVPKRIWCGGPLVNITRSSNGTDTLQVRYRIDNCFVGYLEHVLLSLRFRFLWRQNTSIVLVSPSGTQSRLLRERKYDKEYSIVEWTFMSVHTWGENPVGEWTIKILSSERTNRVLLYSWKLDLYGTVSDPLDGVQKDGDIGGFCNSTIRCQTINSVCLESDGICIDCSNGFHIIGESCFRDGIESGYCDTSVVCIDKDIGCNATLNQCVKCVDGFHIINSFCVEDGVLGGYCDTNLHCTELGIGCDRTTSICINCTNGYRVINNVCVKDGEIGGHCDSKILCVVNATGCDRVSSLCVFCGTGSYLVGNYCIKDGSLGGLCNFTFPCKDVGIGCDLESKRCINCDFGFTAIGGICVKDGTIGGYCNEYVKCKASISECAKNMCVLLDPGPVGNMAMVLGGIFGSLGGAMIIVTIVLAVRKHGCFANKIWPVKSKRSTGPDKRINKQTSNTGESDYHLKQ